MGSSTWRIFDWSWSGSSGARVGRHVAEALDRDRGLRVEEGGVVGERLFDRPQEVELGADSAHGASSVGFRQIVPARREPVAEPNARGAARFGAADQSDRIPVADVAMKVPTRRWSSTMD
jgi:hypothetical protein